MRITKVSITPVAGSKTLKALVNITFDDCLIVKDLRLIEEHFGYIIAMPSKRIRNGNFIDMVYPTDKSTMDMIRKEIFKEYERIRGQKPEHMLKKAAGELGTEF